MNAIAKVEPKQFGIEEKKAEELTSGLTTILEERSELTKQYKDVITFEICEENIPQFRELRLKIRDNRTKGIENWHKVNKAFFLAGGRFVDAIKNKEIAENLRMEERLLEGEKHFENLEQERLNKLNEKRIAAVSPFVEDTTGMNLSLMDEDVFEAYLTAKKTKWEAAQAEIKKAEEERLENEKKDKLERERRIEIAPFSQFIPAGKEIDYREMPEDLFKKYKSELVKTKKAYDKKQAEIAAENKRLKKEAEEKAEIRKSRAIILRPYLAYVPDMEETLALPDKEFKKSVAGFKKELEEAEAFKAKEEAKAEKERELQAKKDAKIQEQLKAEREKREKLEAAEKARKDAEAKRIAKEKADAAKAAKAPVKEKLNLWVDSFELPEVDVKNDAVTEINAKFQSFKKWAKNEINNL